MTEPEIIAGISARIAGDGTALVYDGMILDTGELDAYGLTPMSALTVWFDEQMRPLKAELVSEGQLRVACAIENWK